MVCSGASTPFRNRKNEIMKKAGIPVYHLPINLVITKYVACCQQQGSGLSAT